MRTGKNDSSDGTKLIEADVIEQELQRCTVVFLTNFAMH
jgi:hypothetical protein